MRLSRTLPWALALLPLLTLAQSNYEQWLAGQRQAFQGYLDAQDRQFSTYLRQQWQAFEVFTGETRDPTPKPVRLPVAPPRPKAPEAPPRPGPASPPAAKPPLPKAPPRDPVPRRPVPSPSTPSTEAQVELDFFGLHLALPIDRTWSGSRLRGVDNQGIADHWATLARSRYQPGLKALQALKTRQHFNDWSFAHLVDAYSAQIYPKSPNEQALLTWFLLTKAGYSTRVGYDAGRVYLLLASHQTLFDTPYFQLEGRRFYLVSFSGQPLKARRIHTYKTSYAQRQQAVDLRLAQGPALPRREASRDLGFDYAGRHHTLKLTLDQNTLAFLNRYPQTDLEVYFTAPPNSEIRRQLLAQLRPLVTGKDEREAANLLLRFVQTAFGYQTDQQQFGEENYLFPEETLAFPYSDCEDRAALFAWLVRSLLDLPVIGLSFPGHVATAIAFHGQVPGEAVRHQGRRYVIADPTYINANVGMKMPGLGEAPPQVVAQL